MADIPKPITREDMYYNYLINGDGTLPKPITRREMYLYYLCTNGFVGGGTVTPEMIDAAVDAALKLAKDYTDDVVSNAGYSLGLNIDSDYIMTLELKNADGIVVSAKSVDFPIESMVVGASYADGIVTLSLQNGDEIGVDVSDLVNGLINDNFTIAGINMKDAITAEELRTALNVPEAVKIKGNAESQYRTGNVNLTPANIGAVATSKVLSTEEQINANTDTTNVAGATAVKAMVGDINSNLANKLKIVTILGINTYSTNIEYTPANKANAFTYYVPILNWRRGAVVAKQTYDSTYDAVIADIPFVDSSICVIRHATFLINKTTGAIKITKLNQANLQSDGNYIFSINTVDGIGLLGISW